MAGERIPTAQLIEQHSPPENCQQKISRVAGACFIQFSVKTEDDLTNLFHRYGSMLSNLTDEEIEDVELTHLLLDSAEKAGNQLYDQASKLLEQCKHGSCKAGNPVQRVIYYFVGALQERIDREMGKFSLKGLVRKGGIIWGENVEEMMAGPNPATLACYRQLPIMQVVHFAEIQAILETMVSARKTHLIDLGIKIGMHWSILMQVLAVQTTYPIKVLKISAVGKLRKNIVETGRWLASFAETLKLPFTFKAVIVSDIKDLSKDLSELEDGEAIGVYAPLTNLLRVLKKLKPRIMTVTEVEGNHNSCSFINKSVWIECSFINSCSFITVWFDCLEDCMDRNEPNRMSTEEDFLSQGIGSIVGAEGDERMIRHVKIDTWRLFFNRFGFVEIAPSPLSLYQSRLIIEQSGWSSSLNLNINGKGLTVGWKGNPLLSFSSWKLIREVWDLFLHKT